MHSKVLVVAGMMAAALCVAPAASHAAEVTAGTDLATSYVWRGITFNDGFVLQPSVDVAHESGLGFNTWMNYDLESYGGVQEGEFQEVDLTVYYGLPLGVDNLDVSVGLIQYIFPEAGSDTSTREVYLSASTGVEMVSFSADVYYDFDEVGGFYVNTGAALDLLALVEDSPEELGLEFSGAIGFADDDFATAYGAGDAGAFDWNLGLSTSYAVTEAVEVSAYLMYTDNADSDTLADQEVDVLGGIGVYYAF